MNRHGKVGWLLSERDENIVSDDLYYAFITLKGKRKIKPPDFYIVPSKFVADYIKKTHEYWATRPPKVKRKEYESMSRDEIVEMRRKSKIRHFPNDVGKDLPEFKDFDINVYKDRWDLLDP